MDPISNIRAQSKFALDILNVVNGDHAIGIEGMAEVFVAAKHLAELVLELDNWRKDERISIYADDNV